MKKEKPEFVIKYGRQWTISTAKYDVGNDWDWFFVAEFSEGVLHMNYELGILLLIQKDGIELECCIK